MRGRSVEGLRRSENISQQRLPIATLNQTSVSNHRTSHGADLASLVLRIFIPCRQITDWPHWSPATSCLREERTLTESVWRECGIHASIASTNSMECPLDRLNCINQYPAPNFSTLVAIFPSHSSNTNETTVFNHRKSSSICLQLSCFATVEQVRPDAEVKTPLPTDSQMPRRHHRRLKSVKANRAFLYVKALHPIDYHLAIRSANTTRLAHFSQLL